MKGRRVRTFLDQHRLPVVVLAIAFLIRLAYLLAYARSPFFQVHVADALYHEQWAGRILGGDFFSLRMPGVFYKAPLYPYFLAASYGLSGKSNVFVAFLQVLMSSASCVLLFLVGKRYFGTRAALVGAMLYVLYYPAIYFAAEIEIPTLAIFLTLLSYYLLLAGRGTATWILSAIALGLSLLALPSNLLVLPLYVFLASTRTGEAKQRLKRASLYFAVVCATVVPCTARNLVVGHRPTLISANGGINLYIGNNQSYDRTVYLQPGYAFDDFYDEPRRITGAASIADRDRYWYRKTFDFVSRHPGQEAALLLKKVTLYFADYEISRNTDLSYAKAHSIYRAVPFIPAALLLAAGLGGLALAIRERKGGELAALGGLLALPCIVFFVTDRYRLPSMGVWSLFAGLFVALAIDAIKARAWRAVVPMFAAVAIVGAASGLNLFVVRNPPYRPHLNLGFIYETQTNLGSALEEYRTALGLLEKQEPRDLQTESELYARIGNVQMTANDLEAARESFERALVANPTSVPAYSYLGTLYAKDRQPDRAAEMFNKALALDPGDVVSLHNFALLDLENDRIEQALAKLGRVLELAPEHAGAHSDLAYAYAKQGRGALAESEALRALYYDPEKVPARYNLAALYLGAGRIEEAMAQYQTITRIAPRDASNAFNHLGVIWARKGDLQQALGNWQKALQADPANESARENVQRARSMLQMQPSARP
jgi:Tfp pilus assembly protein PilF/4-amino-4-deoxy-L-arabinose transferase-like glycosyltransferase